MDPISILGISLATIIAGEALLVKAYILFKHRFQQRKPVSSQVLDTT